MAYLKAYAKEQEKWPWHQSVKLNRDICQSFTRAVAARFNVRVYGVNLTKLDYRSGHAGPGPYIDLGKNGSTVGVVFHEVAHLMDKQQHDGNGHTGTFWDCLHKVYAFFDRAHIKAALRAAVSQERAEDARRKRFTQRHLAAAERRAEAKANRQTRAYKMEQLRKRIAKAETRIKRLTTALKSSKRSLAAYERSENRAADVAARAERS